MHRWRTRSRGDLGFGCDWRYFGEPTIAGLRSGDTRTAIMSFSMYSPKCIPAFPGVESTGDNVYATVVGRDVEQDVRIPTNKVAYFRRQHGIYRQPWHKQPHATYRLISEARDLAQRLMDFGERRAQTGAEMLPCFGQGDASCGSRQ